MGVLDVNLFGDPVFEEKRKMRDYFIVPPFSILDTRTDEWQGRRRRWLSHTGKLEATREGVLSAGGGMMSAINSGTSNFDPVLCEVLLKWFNVDGGRVLDPFSGGQTRGVVSGMLGYSYAGVEKRSEQVVVNRTQIETLGLTSMVRYYCGDSNSIENVVTCEHRFDFLITSPPYYDLEVYSQEDLSALPSYGQFLVQYENIFSQCYEMLAVNRFAVLQVGEIRSKTGEYRNFVGDTITIMQRVGFHYYNELILLNSVGTLPKRSANSMNASRKIGKQHQNILVFYKGDIKKIGSLFKIIMPKNEYYSQNGADALVGNQG